jgi:hypothetical protein
MAHCYGAPCALAPGRCRERSAILEILFLNIAFIDAAEMVSQRTRSPAPPVTRSANHKPSASSGFSALNVSSCVSFYFVVSLSLTFLNKTVLANFKCPFFMTWMQFFVALLCLKCLGFFGRFSSLISKDIGIRDYSFSLETLKKTLPLGISYVAM